MAVDYQKMYAYLVGQVDDSLQMIADALIDEDPGRDELVAVGNKLKAALEEVEEEYILADEDEFEPLLSTLRSYMETKDAAKLKQSVKGLTSEELILFQGIIHTAAGIINGYALDQDA